MPIHSPNQSGKPYRPANGTEGDMFQESYCDKCSKYSPEEGCDILLNTMVYEIGDSDYPKEWKFDENGHPTCTAYQE